MKFFSDSDSMFSADRQVGDGTLLFAVGRHQRDAARDRFARRDLRCIADPVGEGDLTGRAVDVAEQHVGQVLAAGTEQSGDRRGSRRRAARR